MGFFWRGGGGLVIKQLPSNFLSSRRKELIFNNLSKLLNFENIDGKRIYFFGFLFKS